jgi:murein DD-endopeptidase MepM/ murein hydrolase activator NlpD
LAKLHKRSKKKILNILLIPDNQEAPPKNFRVRYTTLKFVIAGLVIFMVSVVFGIVTYSQVLQAALEKNEREKELLQLREQLKKGYQLQTELDTLRAYREKVRNSLQGYVKFVEKAGEDVLTSKNLIENDLNKISIFTNVPLKMPVQGFVSQEYKRAGHTGIDIVASEGTPVHAAGDGVVVFSGWTYKDGYILILYHHGGYLTCYRHNAQNLVMVNQPVKQGDVIALLGNSGESSSGPHLHFEIWKDGEPINPRDILLDLNSGE